MMETTESKCPGTEGHLFRRIYNLDGEFFKCVECGHTHHTRVWVIVDQQGNPVPALSQGEG